MEQSEESIPKQWMDCTQEEQATFINSLTKLYHEHDLKGAQIEQQQQVSMNLGRGKTSSEHFLFSENLFSISKESTVETFNQKVRSQLQDKYDDSTAVVIAESGFIKGDEFPDIRGLLHIKDEVEQKIFSSIEARANILVILWSSKYQNLESYLDQVDQIVQDSKIKCYAVNTDKVFLYNENIQKILIGKLNLRFLRDSQFSNINNLFSVNYVRNIKSAPSTTPFVIITDNTGKIAYAQPNEKVDKIKDYLSQVINQEAYEIQEKAKQPFVDAIQDEFESDFSKAITALSGFAVEEGEHKTLLHGFLWKRIIAVKVKQTDVTTQKDKFRSTFMINLKGKEKDLNVIKSELDKIIEQVKRDGFYFKFNTGIIPVFSVEYHKSCTNCQEELSSTQFIAICEEKQSAFCEKCSKFIIEPLLFISEGRTMEDLVQFQIQKKDPTKKSSSSSVQCDACQQFYDGTRYKCAHCPDFDMCEECFTKIEIERDPSKDEEFGVCSCHLRGKHPFWIIKEYKQYDIIK